MFHDWLFNAGLLCAILVIGALIVLAFSNDVASWFDQARKQADLDRRFQQENIRELIVAISEEDDPDEYDWLKQALSLNLAQYRGRTA